MTAYRTGQTVEVHTPARAYSHGGYTDPNCIIPAETITARIERVTRSKRGETIWLRPLDGSSGRGLIIDVHLARGGTIRTL